MSIENANFTVSSLPNDSTGGDEVQKSSSSCLLDTTPMMTSTGRGLTSHQFSESSTTTSSLSSDHRSLPLIYVSGHDIMQYESNSFNRSQINKSTQSNPEISMNNEFNTATLHSSGTRRDGLLMRQVSDASGGSGQDSRQSNNSSNNGGNTASGQWGWFEDVHEQDGLESGSNDKKIQNTAIEKKKKGALLYFGEPFAGPLNEIIAATRGARSFIGAVTAPTYVLEESLSSQNLWKDTAGTRPPQPVDERAFFERIWAQNFARSQVMYTQPVEVLTARSPISLSPFADGNAIVDCLPNHLQDGDTYDVGDNSGGADTIMVDTALFAQGTTTGSTSIASQSHQHNRSPGGRTYLSSVGPYHHHHTLVNKKVKADGKEDVTVLVRGDNVFGTTVSKSFTTNGNRPGAAVTVSISIASYRVVESKHHGKYAQFLVIYCEGNFRNTVGVWKRYRDFEQLSRKVTHDTETCTNVLAGMHPLSVTEDPVDHELLPNAITSWRLLKKRQRWYRCLDAGYLSLKVFLLERFLHDILFESSSPEILRDFVAVWNERIGS